MSRSFVLLFSSSSIGNRGAGVARRRPRRPRRPQDRRSRTRD
ncbi:MAG TPA: hypothetical protein VF030_02555 [Solirubrobacterales bacterium]